MRILVLDDYRPHGESLAELLQERGHDALYAPSCSEADWLLELFRFDLAILDFDMPERTGPQVALELAVRFPHLRSVIVSAHPPEGQRREALGDLTFLPKPIPQALLFELIARLEADLRGSAMVVHRGFSVTRYRRNKPST